MGKSCKQWIGVLQSFKLVSIECQPCPQASDSLAKQSHRCNLALRMQFKAIDKEELVALVTAGKKDYLFSLAYHDNPTPGGEEDEHRRVWSGPGACSLLLTQLDFFFWVQGVINLLAEQPVYMRITEDAKPPPKVSEQGGEHELLLLGRSESCQLGLQACRVVSCWSGNCAFTYLQVLLCLPLRKASISIKQS